MTFYLCYGITEKENKIDEIRGFQHGGLSAEGMRLYFITEGKYFNELADDKTVEHYKIKDGDNLYLLSYRWTYKCHVWVTKVDTPLPGVEQEDTYLGIKGIKVQDQLGIPANLLMLYRVENNSYKVYVTRTPPLSSTKAEPTLALKPRGDVTKQGYQWPHKKDSCPPKIKKNKK